jgi:hypothetical protein
MKANKAPEKIYYAPYGDIREDYPVTDNDIEYIRKDAFMEKAEEWLRKNQEGFILTNKDIIDFINYMKGE